MTWLRNPAFKSEHCIVGTDILLPAFALLSYSQDQSREELQKQDISRSV